MRLNVSCQGDVTIVMFKDKRILDESQIREIGQELFELVEKENRKRVLLNFHGVEFMSSAMLQKFFLLNRKISNLQGRLVLCEMSGGIYEVFMITRLNKFFKIYSTEGEGIEALFSK